MAFKTVAGFESGVEVVIFALKDMGDSAGGIEEH
jgi:hypothetical protein